jgi:hypothetical protein
MLHFKSLPSSQKLTGLVALLPSVIPQLASNYVRWVIENRFPPSLRPSYES